MGLIVNSWLCPGNHACPAVKVCAPKALTQDGVAPPTVDVEKCTGCGKCAVVCPTGALRMAGLSG